MNITFNLTVFQWRIATFDVRIDVDKSSVSVEPIVDRTVKDITRRWFRHMVS